MIKENYPTVEILCSSLEKNAESVESESDIPIQEKSKMMINIDDNICDSSNEESMIQNTENFELRKGPGPSFGTN